MSKLNLSLFVSTLAELPSAEGLLDDRIGEPYLLKRVIFPLLNGETVSIDDLGYERIRPDCIDVLIRTL